MLLKKSFLLGAGEEKTGGKRGQREVKGKQTGGKRGQREVKGKQTGGKQEAGRRAEKKKEKQIEKYLDIKFN